jgi:PAS domain S-box-containing protein
VKNRYIVPILFLVFVSLAAGIVATGCLLYRSQYESCRTEAERNLAAVADLKVNDLSMWRNERLADANVFYKNKAFSALVRRCLERPRDLPLQEELRTWIGHFQVNEHYDRIALFAATGNTWMVVSDTGEPLSAATHRRVRDALQSREVTFTDFDRNDHTKKVFLRLFVPILDGQAGSRPLGVLMLRIDPKVYLFPFLQRWPTPSQTAETLLVRREKNEAVFLNELKFRKNTALALRVPLSSTDRPAVKAALGQEGIVEGVDYRGVPVLAAMRVVPHSPWLLVARVDAAEVYAPMRERLWLVVLFVGVLLFGAAAVVGFLWRQQHAALYREKYESESRMRIVTDSAHDGILMMDLQGRVSYWNPAAERIFGYTSAEALGQNLHQLIAPQRYHETHRAAFPEFQRTGRDGALGKTLELEARRKDGQEVPVTLSLSSIQVGGEWHAVGIVRDETQRKRAEERASLEENRAKSLLELSQMTDRSAAEIANQAMESAIRLVGSTIGYIAFANEDETVLTMHYWSNSAMRECAMIDKPIVYRVEDTGLWGEAIRQRKPVITNNYAAPNPLKKGAPPGHVRLTRHMSIPVFDGDRIVAVAGVGNKAENYTEDDARQLMAFMDGMWRILCRKRAEDDLVLKNVLLHAQQEASIDGILAVDGDEKVILFNRRFVEMWNLPPEMVESENDAPVVRWVQSLVADGDAFAEKVRYLYDHRHETSRDEIALTNGKTFDRYSSPMFGPDDRYFGRVWYFRDVTEPKRAEQELILASHAAEAATRAKSAFLANMSHEIRTPMTAILGFADVLRDEIICCPVCAENATCQRRRVGQEAVNTIQRNGEHLLGLINDILDLSKIEAGKFQIDPSRCSPIQLVAEVVSMMRVRAAEKHLELKTELACPLPKTVLTDPLRLRQVLVNLMGNAIKFTDQGEIRLAVRLISDDGPSRLRFDVTDTGVGMNEEQLGKLFQPFNQVDSSSTRKVGGTGLGLCISKHLAEVLGGHIEVRSAPGKGSTFSVTINPGPLDGIDVIHNAQEAFLDRPSTTTPAASDSSALQGRILLAEDGPDNRRLIAMLLTKVGAHVTAVENGQLAVDVALAACDAGEPFDVILMDMQMPVMDGYEATRQLRQRGHTIPIVALTAHAMAEDCQKCLDAGCDGYATKPIDRQKLLATVAPWLARGRMRADAPDSSSGDSKAGPNVLLTVAPSHPAADAELNTPAGEDQ